MAVSVGGFFASLKLQSDQASFDKAKKDLGEVEGQTKKTGLEFSKFAGSVVAGFALIGGAAVGAAYAIAGIQGKMGTIAKTAGLGYSEMNKWSMALKLIGLDASGVAGSMGQLNSAFSDYKKGFNVEAYQEVIKNLSLLGGIDPQKFGEMGGTEKALALAGQYEKNPNKETLDLIDKIMPGMAQILVELQKNKDIGDPNTTLRKLLESGGNKPMLSERQQKEAMAGERSLQGLEASISGLFNLFGATMLKVLKKPIDELTKFIDTHGDEIAGFFKMLGDVIYSVIELLKPVLGTIYESLKTAGKLIEKYTPEEQRAKDIIYKYDKQSPGTSEAVGRKLEEITGRKMITGIDALTQDYGKVRQNNTEIERMEGFILTMAEKYLQLKGSSAYDPETKNAQVTVGQINLYGEEARAYIEAAKGDPAMAKQAGENLAKVFKGAVITK